MAVVLMSMLGRGQRAQGKGYREATYAFEGPGGVATSYFALALLEHLRGVGEAVERLVVLGTAGSMWDLFFLDQEAEGDGGIDLAELEQAVQGQVVTQAMLDGFSGELSRRLGCEVRPVLIPSARDLSEQIAILRCLREVVQEGDRIVLDVTHGFRHLPMLALVAARFLERAVGVEVVEIFYGALEMTPPGGATPVLRLRGLAQLLDGVEALASYDKDGDYGVFAPLLRSAGVPEGQVGGLERAAFAERVTHPHKAREQLSPVWKGIEGWGGPLVGFFAPEIKRRIDWVCLPDRASWELRLGDHYFARGDYLRAVIFWLEGRITRAAEGVGADSRTYEGRNAAKAALKDAGFRELSGLRNAMAHGSTGAEAKKIRALLEDEGKLRARLGELRRGLESG